MGAFISLAFQWRGTLADLSPLDRALASAGLAVVDPGEAAEGQRISTWTLPIASERQQLVCRCYDAGAYVSTTLDIEEERFDELAERLGRPKVIDVFVTLGAHLLRALGLRYAFFDEEAEADLDPESFDGSRLFGISIVPDDAPWLMRALERANIQRLDRLPGAVVIYRRVDPVPHRG
jgi:hypothetical protein